jgi:hypothetical protein
MPIGLEMLSENYKCVRLTVKSFPEGWVYLVSFWCLLLISNFCLNIQLAFCTLNNLMKYSEMDNFKEQNVFGLTSHV